jgi:hypothetical protein
VKEYEPDVAGASEAFEKAFPEDDFEETPEWRQASHRSNLLAARLLAALVANTEYVARASAWLLDGASRALEGAREPLLGE